MKKIGGKKGSAFVWLKALFMVVIIGMLYILLTRQIIAVDRQVTPTFNETSNYTSTYQKISTIWDYWLVIFLVGGVVTWGIMESMKRKQYDGFG